jgi:hypothetical protein
MQTYQTRDGRATAGLHVSAKPRAHMELAAKLQHTALSAYLPPAGSLLDAFR